MSFTYLFTFLTFFIWFVHTSLSRPKKSIISPKQPKIELYSKVRSEIRSGDLLMTRASNNLFSDLQCKWLQTPISHVGIAVVENEGNDLTRVFMFESSPGRGAQLRDLEDYAKNGVRDVFIKPLNRDDIHISKHFILRTLEEFSRAEYSFKYLADIPHELFGFDRENDDSDNENDLDSYSCADLVYAVYKKLGIVKQLHQKKRWFPKDFFLNKVDFVDFACSDIRSVFFDDLDRVEKKRTSLSFEKIFKLLEWPVS